MSKITLFLITQFIKFYKFLISPILGNKCRYLPTCSDYFLESLKIHGVINGSCLGIKRIVSCHPIKFIDGNSGLDLVKKKKNNTREN